MYLTTKVTVVDSFPELCAAADPLLFLSISVLTRAKRVILRAQANPPGLGPLHITAFLISSHS